MTAYRCWLEFPNDHSLRKRIDDGEFGDGPPTAHFPPGRLQGAWPGVVCTWARERGLPFHRVDLVVRVKVKKAMVEDFIAFAYDGDPSYTDPARMLTWKGRAYLANRLNDLRAFVAKELNPRLWYVLKADEF